MTSHDRGREAQGRTCDDAPGNLARAYGDEVNLNWPGCQHQDCLPKCQTTKNHCERLKLWLEKRGLQ